MTPRPGVRGRPGGIPDSAPGLKWFALLVATQAVHSFEEWAFELWRVYPPAGMLSGLFGEDLALNFGVLNILVVLAMTLTLLHFRRRGRFSVALASFWIGIEFVNGINHLAQAGRAGGYFPGAGTAAFLVLFAAIAAVHVYRQPGPSSS